MTRASLCMVASSFVFAACIGMEDLSRPTIARESPSPVVPLASPSHTMKAQRGSAQAPYPNDFAATVKPDGTVVFPQNTIGKVKGPSVFVDGAPVLTVGTDGSVKGPGLKRPYRFAANGDLVDDAGHGVRITSGGTVRGIGGAWRQQDVLAWTVDDGTPWDKAAWRTLELVALVMIENMLPKAIRDDTPATAPSAAETGDGAPKKGGIYIPPPSEWFK